jgi:hypothetical protein
MDFSKFKTPDWLVIGGGLAVLIGGLLDWFSVDGGGSGGNAFDFFLTGTVPWILIVGAAVITFLLVGGIMNAGGPPWTLIVLGLTVLGALLLVLRLIMGADASDFGDLPDGVADFGLDRAFGLYLTVLGGVVAAVGAFLGFQASGGNVRDLTDMDKMKSAFK